MKPFESLTGNFIQDGCTTLIDVYMVNDVSIGIDPEKKLAQLEVRENFMSIDEIIKKHPDLWLFAQYQTELFWFRNISKEDIKRITKKRVIQHGWFRHDQIVEEEYIQITVPLKRAMVMQIGSRH